MNVQYSYSTSSPGEAALGLIPVLLILLVSLGIIVFLCYYLSKLQERVPPEHRRIPPAHTWLLLIPLFNLVWNFFVYPKIAESYASYFHSIGRLDVGDAGRGIGLAFAICAACSVIPCVNFLTAPAALVLLILYLVKLSGLKNQIPAGPVAYGFPPVQPPAQQ